MVFHNIANISSNIFNYMFTCSNVYELGIIHILEKNANCKGNVGELQIVAK